jgi:glycosyltransferase involved in cell wall biosynthesis
MKILLVGNYIHDSQQSMQRFAKLMMQSLRAIGHDVRVVQPKPFFGKLAPGETGLGKWLGYVDRFLLFWPSLRREAAWADVVHICDHANAVYAPFLGSKPHVVTCHDVLAIRSALGEISSHATRWSGRMFQRWIVHGLRQAQLVVCVSNQTRAELLRIARLASGRTPVVHNALNYPYRPMPPDEARARIRALHPTENWPFFLNVGGNQWYKNRAGVVRIFAGLANLPGFERHHLVMVGKPWPRDVRQLVQSYGLSARIHECVQVCEEDLRALYSLAEALLFPSLEEGFGWPILEAQACGCPVIVSGRPPMTEVAGDAAIYIQPDEEAVAAQLIVQGFAKKDSLAEAGLKNVERFSAARMLEGYVEAYASVLNPAAER